MISNQNTHKELDKLAYYHSFPKLIECTCTAELKKLFKNEPVTLMFKELNQLDKQEKKARIVSLSFGAYQIQVNDIKKIEDETYSIELTVCSSKGNYTFKFKTLSDKYYVKSLIYNTLLTSIKRKYKETVMKLRVSVITWNLAEIQCPNNLERLFERTPPNEIDILAIGAQECALMHFAKWKQNFKKILLQYDLVEIESESLFQMFIIVFIKKDIMCLVNRIEKDKRPMGFGNIVGNKGGIIVSFFLMGYHLVFINCHLAPKMFKVLERNKMAKNIVDAFKLGDRFADFDILADYTYWFGDMNYRVDCSYDETVNELMQKNINVLLTKDQLTKHRKNNEIFCRYIEPEITFLPTYRRNKPSKIFADDEKTHRQCEQELFNCKEKKEEHDNGNSNNNNENSSNNIDKLIDDYSILSYQNTKDNETIYRRMYSNKDNQSPSWCDRILLKTHRNVKVLLYDALDFMRKSDHLPVVANYSIYLSLPLLTNLTQPSEDLIYGILKYKTILFKYNCSLLNEIIELKEVSYFLLEIHYFTQETPSQSISNEITFEEKDWMEKPFQDFVLKIPPILIYDYPQMKAFNIFFVLKAKIPKKTLDIGYAKYSFEEFDKSNSMLHHEQKLDVIYHLTSIGILSFEANYFCDQS